MTSKKYKCLSCGSTHITRLNTYKRYWNFCNDCGAAYNEQKSWYPLSFIPFGAFGSGNKTEESMYDYFVTDTHIEYCVNDAKEFIGKFIKPNNINLKGKKVLDISGGNGHFAKELQKIGADIDHTEINDNSINYVKDTLGLESYKFNFNNDDISKTIKNTKYDVVLLRAAMMFCVDIDKFSKQLKKILKPNAIVMMVNCVTPTLGTVIRTQFDEFSYYRLCEPEYIAGLFEKNKFDTVKIQNETDDSLYVYDHDKHLPYMVMHYLYEIWNTFKLRKKWSFKFPARDRRRAAIILKNKAK